MPSTKLSALVSTSKDGRRYKQDLWEELARSNAKTGGILKDLSPEKIQLWTKEYLGPLLGSISKARAQIFSLVGFRPPVVSRRISADQQQC